MCRPVEFYPRLLEATCQCLFCCVVLILVQRYDFLDLHARKPPLEKARQFQSREVQGVVQKLHLVRPLYGIFLLKSNQIDSISLSQYKQKVVNIEQNI